MCQSERAIEIKREDRTPTYIYTYPFRRSQAVQREQRSRIVTQMTVLSNLPVKLKQQVFLIDILLHPSARSF